MVSVLIVPLEAGLMIRARKIHKQAAGEFRGIAMTKAPELDGEIHDQN
jgi:hypothetical protein